MSAEFVLNFFCALFANSKWCCCILCKKIFSVNLEKYKVKQKKDWQTKINIHRNDHMESEFWMKYEKLVCHIERKQKERRTNGKKIYWHIDKSNVKSFRSKREIFFGFICINKSEHFVCECKEKKKATTTTSNWKKSNEQKSKQKKQKS